MDNLKNEIYKKIKTARTKRYITNCYSNDFVNIISRYWEYKSSFVFTCFDHGVERAYFFAAAEAELSGLMDSAPDGKLYIEIITKDKHEHETAFSEASVVARMKRIANKDCTAIFSDEQVMQYTDPSIGEFAKIEDAGEINKILWATFSTEISHLLCDDEVAEAIERHEFTVHRDEEGNIDAVLQVVIQPRRFYINQAVNHGERNIINAMLINRIKEYCKAGGKYIFCWVSEDNVASLKWNGKYGMRHDGTWDLIYCIER